MDYFPDLPTVPFLQQLMPTLLIGARAHLQQHTAAFQSDRGDLILLRNFEQIALTRKRSLGEVFVTLASVERYVIERRTILKRCMAKKTTAKKKL
jgi:hypothetical protein